MPSARFSSTPLRRAGAAVEAKKAEPKAPVEVTISDACVEVRPFKRLRHRLLADRLSWLAVEVTDGEEQEGGYSPSRGRARRLLGLFLQVWTD